LFLVLSGVADTQDTNLEKAYERFGLLIADKAFLDEPPILWRGKNQFFLTVPVKLKRKVRFLSA